MNVAQNHNPQRSRIPKIAAVACSLVLMAGYVHFSATGKLIPGMLAALIAFRGIWAIFIHSNVRLPIGPLRVLIGAPELHHWHHDRDRDAGNYANISPIMDVLFGTYKCPDHEPEHFGIDEPAPTSYLGHMLRPFRRPQNAAAPIKRIDNAELLEASSGP